MAQYWVLMVLFYGVSKGLRDGMKKLALQKNSLMEVLLFHSALAFLFTVPTVENVFAIPPVFYLLIFAKSFIIFLAWMFSFRSLSKLPLSSFGILEMSSVVFSTMLGVFLLGEKLYIRNIAGLLLVLSGIFLVNVHRGEDANKGDIKYIWLALASCLLNATSGTMDKIYINYVTAGQLQFWYMFFMVLLYIIYIVATRTKISFSALKSNQWIWLLSILFVLADRALFVANSSPDSSVTVMTLIKQSCVLVAILFGKFVFKEKNILYKLFCSLLIITGILCVTI